MPKQYDEEAEMEKLGVSEGVDDAALEKAASDGCPICGQACTKHGRLLVCPTHGSEPFER